jgi:hypothetical protein
VGVHHPLLEGWLVAPLSISAVQPTSGLIWTVRCRVFVVMLLPTPTGLFNWSLLGRYLTECGTLGDVQCCTI